MADLMTYHYLAHLAESGTADIHPLGRAATRSLMAALAIERRHLVLEIGCGTGSTLVWAAQYGAQVVGIDLLPGMLRMAQKRRQWTGVEGNTAVMQSSAATLPLAAGVMDGVGIGVSNGRASPDHIVTDIPRLAPRGTVCG
ncbi:MAG: class I SAM-dependent methyltransferase [Anaerolineae bacterium]|nr:class I SAM-dependent methyltransferase [Anaerolineae bacterium]